MKKMRFFPEKKLLFLSLLIVSSVFQAASVINIKFDGTYYPILPFYFIESLLLLFYFYIILTGKEFIIFKKSSAHMAFMVLTIFIIYSAATLILLPTFFSSLPVYNPRIGLDAQYNNLTPLSFSLSMVGQLGYLILNSMTFLYIINIKVDHFDCKKINHILLYVVTSVVFIGIWQLAHKITGVYFPDDLIYSALGHSQGSGQQIAGFERINSTFTEPSLLAVFLLSSFAYLMRLLTNRMRPAYMLIGFSVFVLLLMTTSGTAYLGLVVLLLSLIISFSFRILLRMSVSRRALFFISFGVPAIIILSMALYSYSSDMRDLIILALTKKDQSLSFIHRIAADRAALRILLETYGLGVGLGGNRPSSFITYMLSNIGIIGSLLYFLFIGVLLRGSIIVKNYSQQAMDDRYVYVDAAIWAVTFCLVGMAISVPDLSFPVLWMWLFILSFYISRFYHEVHQYKFLISE